MDGELVPRPERREKDEGRRGLGIVAIVVMSGGVVLILLLLDGGLFSVNMLPYL